MDWESCCGRRIAKKVQVDDALISSLRKASSNKFVSQKQLPLTSITASSKISLAYDSLRELLEALALQKGYKIYNHECYTPFLREVVKKSDFADEFDQLRRLRNAVNYYGEEFSVEETKNIIGRIASLRNTILPLSDRNV